MSISRTLMMSLALLAGAAMGCSHNKASGRNGMPSATGTQTAQNTSGGTDVGNGTDASGNTGDDTSTINSQAPQGTTGDTQSPPCNNATITGQAGNPNCDQGNSGGTNTNASGTRSNGSSGGIPTTPDPERP